MSACLLCIDLIDDFLAGHSAEQAATLVARTNDLVSTFREQKLPVIWVRQEFAPDLSDAFLEMRGSGVRVAIAGSPGAALNAGLERRETDIEIVKKRYSAFFGTELDAVLGQLEVTEIVICGVNTHACVRMAAIDAYQRDYRVVIATDCTASYDAEHGAISLRYMEGKIARSMSNQQIAAKLRQGQALTEVR